MGKSVLEYMIDCDYYSILSACKEYAKRVDDVNKFGLWHFKQSFNNFIANEEGSHKPARFATTVEMLKDRKTAEAEAEKITIAVAAAAAAAAANPGFLARIFV